MPWIDKIGNWWIKKRIRDITHFKEHPEEVQLKVLDHLLKTAGKTGYGKQFHFSTITSLKDFQDRVPVNTYEDLLPYITRTLKGEQNVLWPSRITHFAKSSGTTSANSKILPVSRESLLECHYQGGRDMLALYASGYRDTKIFSGKNLSIGGSQESHHGESRELFIGNISAIVMKNLPFWAQYKRTPGLNLTLMNSWEEKIKHIGRLTATQNVTSIAGSPMWIILLLQHIFQERKLKYIQELWPNLEVFFHGSVPLLFYRPLFEILDRDKSLRYLEIYNATEGLFGLQDIPHDPSLLLMLNYNIFYEFLAAEDYEKEDPKVYSLEEVKLHKNYTLLISTNSGLWRYKLGDTIRFTELRPYRFLISGRTKHCLNTFGEDVFVEHAEKALAAACKNTGAIINHYTAAPRFFECKTKGCHEWVIEFAQPPGSIKKFTTVLDRELCNLNDDYRSKREKNIAIELPILHKVAAGTFYQWLKNHNKLGGQHKIPQLSNSREVIEKLLQITRQLHPFKNI